MYEEEKQRVRLMTDQIRTVVAAGCPADTDGVAAAVRYLCNAAGTEGSRPLLDVFWW